MVKISFFKKILAGDFFIIFADETDIQVDTLDIAVNDVTELIRYLLPFFYFLYTFFINYIPLNCLRICAK